MQKTTLIADGKTKDFHFGFDFFLKSNVFVNVNGAPATGYGLICNSNGADADIPFSGGHVHFYKPPKTGDVISICRQLPMERIVDYQLRAVYDPVALNRDMNCLLEIVKDVNADFMDFSTNFHDITDRESVQTVLDRIDVVMPAIDNVVERINHFDDLAAMPQRIENLAQRLDDLTAVVKSNTASIQTIVAGMGKITDYVVESQEPTEENNYIWYRKYKSGWVEQGGLILQASPTGNITLKLPVAMANNRYSAFVTLMSSDDTNSPVSAAISVWNKTTTTLTIRQQATADKNWAVFGMGA